MASNHGWSIRQTGEADRNSLASLLADARWKHLHLDWIKPLDLIGRQPFLLASQSGEPLACLGCPPDPPGIAWVRVFAIMPGYARSLAWRTLLGQACQLLSEQGIASIAALPGEAWMTDLLRDQGFQRSNEVIFLERRGRQPGRQPQQPRPRLMLKQDLPAVLQVDHRAFAPLWRFSLDTLRAALRMAVYASCLEISDRVIGYQICTESSFGAHLARLAVDPEWQGHRLGEMLVLDAMRRMQQLGIELLSVNTQADNQTALQMYAKLGFERTGQAFPVYELRL